jgi:hypothetical protein
MLKPDEIRQEPGYPDKVPGQKPLVESVAGYQTNKEPAAAAFDRGTSTRGGAADAADARREHGADLGPRRSTPTRGTK